MIITSEIIQKNLFFLEKAISLFPVLKDFSDCYTKKIHLLASGIDDKYWKNEEKLRTFREEARNYKLNTYLNFIEFIEESKKYGQVVFYRNKIKNSELQKILVGNSLDAEARECFKNKTKSTFAKLINSKKWLLLSNEPSRTNRNRYSKRYNDNLYHSSAIVANYCIQNEIDLVGENYKRIKHWYTDLIPEPDMTLSNEIKRTSTIIDFMIEKLQENDADYRRVNIDQFIFSIKNELIKKLLCIEKGEKIRCLEIPQFANEELTQNKIYEVCDKRIENGVLKVEIVNDKGSSKQYFYRNFETVSNLRDNFISDLLEEI